MEPDCVEYLVKLAEDNGCEMSTTDAIFTTRDRTQNNEDRVAVLEKERAVASIINTFIIPVGPWNKLYTMDVVRNNNISFSVPWFGEGLYFSAMNAQYSNKMAVGHKKVYNYRLNNPNSGCTMKEVQNGLNSLQNIFYIKDNLVVHSCEIENAFNWHIWTNYFNLINYIYSSNSVDEYRNEYELSKKKLKEYMLSAMKNPLLSTQTKLKILFKTYFPVIVIKIGNRRAQAALAADKME